MKRYLAWDIETTPTAEALSLPYPEDKRQPPANYSKPDTISEWRRRDREAWEGERIKSYCFSARTARIVALSLNYRGEEFVDLTALDPSDEKGLIESALALMVDKQRNDLIVGFNSRQFDWPFLMLRMCYHRIDPYQFSDHRQFWQDLHSRYSKFNIDVMELVNLGNWKPNGSLSDWAAWAGQTAKETDGGMIYQWVQDGDVESIAAHCRGDVQRTGALFERVYPLYWGS